MTCTVPRLITAGVIAAELDEPLYRIVYVLRTRAHITPAAYAGTLRLYHRRSVALIRRELAAIDARRARKAVRRVT